MKRTSMQTMPGLSRRATLGGIGVIAATLGLSRRFGRASAENAASSGLAGHPLNGTWMAKANPPLPTDPQIAAPSYFGADGSVLLMFPLTQVGPQGVQFNSAFVGTWEAVDDRRGHFTAVQVLSDASGAFLGTATVDGYPLVNADGKSFIDDGSRTIVTIRDPAGAIVAQFDDPNGRPVTANRMSPGMPGFPAGTRVATTAAP